MIVVRPKSKQGDCNMTSKVPVLLSAALALLGACNGEIKSRVLTPEQLQAEFSNPQGARGIFGYYNRSAVEIDMLRGLADNSGKPLPGACNPIQVQRISTYTDEDHPVQI
jgi:hypothetical protein